MDCPVEEEDLPPVEAENMPPVEEEDLPPVEAENMPPVEEEDMPPVEAENMPPVEATLVLSVWRHVCLYCLVGLCSHSTLTEAIVSGIPFFFGFFLPRSFGIFCRLWSLE